MPDERDVVQEFYNLKAGREHLVHWYETLTEDDKAILLDHMRTRIQNVIEILRDGLDGVVEAVNEIRNVVRESHHGN